jgi:ribose transport system permease protein
MRAPATSGFRSLWARALADYGMVLALVLLCAYYSWATWRDQHNEGADAGREVAARVSAGDKVLVVAHEGDRGREFADAATKALAARGVASLGEVRGTPADLRAKLDEISAGASAPSADKPIAVAATREAADWLLLQRLAQNGRVVVLAPQPYRGADFLRPSNLANVADRIAVIAIIGIGMTVVILTRGIDLSVGSLIALSAVIVARLARDYGGGVQASTGALVLCCVAAVVACALIGLFSGAMVTLCDVPPFIVTLAMMLVAVGLAHKLSAGQSINDLPEAFVALGRGKGPLGVPGTVLLTAGLYLVAGVLMSRSVAARYVYAIGSNPEGAYYAAVPVRRTVCAAYVLSAGLAGLGGVIEASRLKSGSPTYGNMAELSVIAAVVVGGTSLAGGKGTVGGTLIGALIIAVIQNGMNLTNVPFADQQIVLGGVILGAVLLDRLRNRGRGE